MNLIYVGVATLLQQPLVTGGSCRSRELVKANRVFDGVDGTSVIMTRRPPSPRRHVVADLSPLIYDIVDIFNYMFVDRPTANERRRVQLWVPRNVDGERRQVR